MKETRFKGQDSRDRFQESRNWELDVSLTTNYKLQTTNLFI